MQAGDAVEDALDSVLLCARLPLTLQAYAAHATQHGHRVVQQLTETFALMFCDGFAVMVDGEAPLARIPVVGLFEDDDDESEPYPWVEATTDPARLVSVFGSLRAALILRLGAPTCEVPGPVSCCAWTLPGTVLALLWNDEGDAHIGERSTVDLRIAPRASLVDLPASVATVFAWPIEY